ncbi:hypothetical protein FB45DRAFT_946694 [Roridomyces roridus]|uniref:Uncharacterized protein n=1 Tax=Roridomyces roridus TaxID=1738132 RepID=A0AAD7FAL0_9AGAR|nr:hypothetical protein FB45DRAFT_946694 [Roridomyces roridus]
MLQVCTDPVSSRCWWWNVAVHIFFDFMALMLWWAAARWSWAYLYAARDDGGGFHGPWLHPPTGTARGGHPLFPPSDASAEGTFSRTAYRMRAFCGGKACEGRRNIRAPGSAQISALSCFSKCI